MIDWEAVENIENFVFLESVFPATFDDINKKNALALTAFGRLNNTKITPYLIKIKHSNALKEAKLI